MQIYASKSWGGGGQFCQFLVGAFWSIFHIYRDIHCFFIPVKKKSAREKLFRLFFIFHGQKLFFTPTFLPNFYLFHAHFCFSRALFGNSLVFFTGNKRVFTGINLIFFTGRFRIFTGRNFENLVRCCVFLGFCGYWVPNLGS